MRIFASGAATLLDVLWLEDKSGRPLFYFEEHSTAEPESEPDEAEGTRLQRLRRLLERSYEKLKSRFPVAERLCSHLRFHESVRLHVPDAISEAEAQRLFLGFLRKCVTKHGVWFLIDCLLALAGSALVWVPGPNVFFFYPALRALAHYHAQSGARRHQNGLLIEVRRNALLSDLRSATPAERIRRAGQIEEQFGFRTFATFLGKRYGAD